MQTPSVLRNGDLPHGSHQHLIPSKYRNNFFNKGATAWYQSF